MSASGQGIRRAQSWLRAFFAALLVVTVIGLPAASSAASNQPMNAAGLVIKHGDGTVLYFYVRFSEAELTGTQLLERAGVSADITSYPGMGQAVCRIDGQGCPTSNCFCKSYSNPATYWRYSKLSSNGTWITLPYGPSQRTIHNGDVDGWSWSSKDGDLPPITLEQIAKLNGIVPAGTPEPSATAPKATQVAQAETPIVSSASPVAVGVEVQPSGQSRPISTSTSHSAQSGNSYAWFGAGVVLLALVGGIVVARRGWSER